MLELPLLPFFALVLGALTFDLANFAPSAPAKPLHVPAVFEAAPSAAPARAVVIAIAVVLASLVLWLRARVRQPPAGLARPPVAPGAVPILGHALAYKDDPAAFLVATCESVGPIFSINLAGKRMIVVGPSINATKQVALAPESQLSARQAVADIGFNETLGPLNVFRGTDMHKRWIKDAYGGPSGLEEEIEPLWHSLGRSLKEEIYFNFGTCSENPGDTNTVVADLFGLVRASVLRCQMERLLGVPILIAAGHEHGAPARMGFVKTFMEFQDAIEHATAMAALLPRALALPLVLWPVARRRRRLVARLAQAIDEADKLTELAALGSWYRSMRGRSPALSSLEIAELATGLLFASHKNPSIGAAQTVCALLELPRPGSDLPGSEVREAAFEEAMRMAANPSAATLSECHVIRTAVLETLRLSAHAIGAVRTVAAEGGFILDDKYWAAPGETIALTHIAVHRSEAIWGPNCKRFTLDRKEYEPHVADDPKNEHVMDGNPAGGVVLDEYTYTTFSHGLHKCPGERLALRTMECVVAALLSSGVHLDTELPPVSFERATLAQRQGKVQVLLSNGKLVRLASAY